MENEIQRYLEKLFLFCRSITGRVNRNTLKVLQELIPCSKFVNTINAEGFLFYEGYTKPLYLQAVYQRQSLFKNGDPFSSPENKDFKHSYDQGICPVAERLYNHQMIINEHVRPTNKIEDMKDIV